MGKTITQLDAISALAGGDLFAADDISESDTRKVTADQIQTFLEGQQWDGLNLNEGVALTATSTELNNGCDGIGVTIPRVKLVTIGDWDMDTDATKNNCPH